MNSLVVARSPIAETSSVTTSAASDIADTSNSMKSATDVGVRDSENDAMSFKSHSSGTKLPSLSETVL